MAEGTRTWRTWQLLVGMVAALVVGIGAGSASTPEDEQTVSSARATTSSLPEIAPAPTTTVQPTTTVAPTTTTQPGPKTTFSDGSYRVGVDIEPGTYRSSGTGTDCYWKRMRNFTGVDDIIANYLSNSPTTVTILASDAGFEAKRCGTWTKVG